MKALKLTKDELEAVYFALSRLLDKPMIQREFNFLSDLRDKFTVKTTVNEFVTSLKGLTDLYNIKDKDIITAIGINQPLYSKIKNGKIKPKAELKAKIVKYFEDNFDLK